MLEPVSVLLKFGFLAVLYLFLIGVARSALRELRQATDLPAPLVGADATGMHPAAAGLASAGNGLHPVLRVERGPGLRAGDAIEVGGSATLGRSGSVDIPLEDPFASSRHARITREGPVVVLEDLGSTNGTYLNGEPLRGPQPLHPGDRIRIGDSEFSFGV